MNLKIRNLISFRELWSTKLPKFIFAAFRAKWYTVSVTEEEVHRGLLYVDNRDQKTFFYRRKIIDLEKHYQDKAAVKFIDKKVRRVWAIRNLYVRMLGHETPPTFDMVSEVEVLVRLV